MKGILFLRLIPALIGGAIGGIINNSFMYMRVGGDRYGCSKFNSRKD